ncbi:hypothetical protein [Haliangium sp.]
MKKTDTPVHSQSPFDSHCTTLTATFRPMNTDIPTSTRARCRVG